MNVFPWPPHTCTIAFIAKARSILGLESMDPRRLARKFAVRVPFDQPNPWALDTADDTLLCGINPHQLGQLWHTVFNDGPTFSFRYVPFNTVQFGCYWDVALEALDRGFVLGVGFNYALFTGNSSASHVCRVQSIQRHQTDDYRICLVDDFDNGKVSTVDSRLLEQATNAVSGGFWLIGPKDKMNLPYALPYTM
jgi:hypothetical protein